MSTENKTKLNESLLTAFNEVVSSKSDNLFAEASKKNAAEKQTSINEYNNEVVGRLAPDKLNYPGKAYSQTAASTENETFNKLADSSKYKPPVPAGTGDYSTVGRLAPDKLNYPGKAYSQTAASTENETFNKLADKSTSVTPTVDQQKAIRDVSAAPAEKKPEFKFNSKGGKVSADELDSYRKFKNNTNVTLGQYMNDRDKLTAIKGGKNDPSVIQKKLAAGQTAYDPGRLSEIFSNEELAYFEAVAPTPKKYAPNGSDKTNATGSKSGTLSDTNEEIEQVDEVLDTLPKMTGYVGAHNRSHKNALASGDKETVRKRERGAEIFKSRFAKAQKSLKKEEVEELDENNPSLSPKQKNIARLAGDKEKIDAEDMSALRAGKHKMKETVSEESKYTVKSGDTLYDLAKKNKTTVDAITKSSGIKDPNKLRIGQEIVIPTSEKTAPLPLPRRAERMPSSTVPTTEPVEKQISQNPANVSGKAVSSPDPFKAPVYTPASPPSSLTADQDAAYADRIADAEAEEKKASEKINAYVQKPKTSSLHLRDPLRGFDLGKYGRDKIANAEAEKINAYVEKPNAYNLPIDNPLVGFDLGKYGRDKKASTMKENNQITEARGRPPKEASLGANELHMNAKRAADNMTNITHKFANGDRVKMTKGMGVAFLNRHTAARTPDEKDALLNYAHQSPETFENVSRGGSIPKAEKVGIKLGSMKAK